MDKVLIKLKKLCPSEKEKFKSHAFMEAKETPRQGTDLNARLADAVFFLEQTELD